MAQRSWTLPNIITLARIGICPVLFWMALAESPAVRLSAFVLFVVAALSDLWDGYLARKHGWITEAGKLLDPIADKLLLISTLVPIYLVSHRGDPLAPLPWWGPLPVWVLVVILGRELLVTTLRAVAARGGRVLSAGPSGKYKAFVQNLFAGAALLWYPVVIQADREAWDGPIWAFWEVFHGGFLGLALVLALILTLLSLADYLRSWYSRAPAA